MQHARFSVLYNNVTTHVISAKPHPRLRGCSTVLITLHDKCGQCCEPVASLREATAVICVYTSSSDGDQSMDESSAYRHSSEEAGKGSLSQSRESRFPKTMGAATSRSFRSVHQPPESDSKQQTIRSNRPVDSRLDSVLLESFAATGERICISRMMVGSPCTLVESRRRC